MSVGDPNGQPEVRKNLFSRRDAATALGGISVRELDRALARGDINAKMLGRRVMFTPCELERFVANLPDWEPTR